MSEQEYKKLESIEKRKRKDGTVMPDLSEEELAQRSRHIDLMTKAAEVRDSEHKEFDGMGYLARYETNQQADNSYLPPKLNREDVRIVTGTTREKDNSLLAGLLNYNFECSVTAYDRDGNEVDEIGTHLADLVRKSREVEQYDDKRDLIYREMIAQGDVFVMDSLVTKFRVDRRADFDWKEGVHPSKFKVTASTELDYQRPEATLLSGTKVYQGNFREPVMGRQPHIVVVEDAPYAECRAQYEKWERWQNVPTKIDRVKGEALAGEYRDWTMVTHEADFVEKAWFMDASRNEVQLYLNGVPMLPVGFPLDLISPSGEYPVAKGSIERMPFCAYSKGMPEKMKVDQAVVDEMLKLAVLKTQQSFKPTLFNNSKKELSSDMFIPGAVIDDVGKDEVGPIFAPTGVTPSEAAFMNYMKEIQDLKSVNAQFSGEKPGQTMTATQVLEMKKAQMSKLGLVIWGVVQFEQRMNWLRLHNVLRYGLGDQQSGRTLGEARTVMVDTTLENGKKGRRVYEFDADKANTLTEDQIRIESELLTARYGMETRKVYINPEAVRKARLFWRVTIVPTEKDSSELQSMRFEQKLLNVIRLFGPALNMQFWMELWAAKNEVDPKRAFLAAQPPNPAIAGGAGGGAAAGGAPPEAALAGIINRAAAGGNPAPPMTVQ